MEDRFRRYLNSISDSNKQEFTEYIHAILFSEQFIPPGYNDPLLDPGLFYIDTDRSVCLINKHAYRMLMTGFLRFVQRKEISKLQNLTEQGLELERQVWYGLLNRGSLKYRSLFKNDYPETSSSSNDIDFTTTTTTTTSSSAVALTASIHFSSYEISRSYIFLDFKGNNFKNIGSFSNNVRNSGESVIIRHLSCTFPRVDFIIIDFTNNTVYLLQVTIQNPSGHEKPGRVFLDSVKTIVLPR